MCSYKSLLIVKLEIKKAGITYFSHLISTFHGSVRSFKEQIKRHIFKF
jgi:hypothetical protein